MQKRSDVCHVVISRSRTDLIHSCFVRCMVSFQPVQKLLHFAMVDLLELDPLQGTPFGKYR